MWESRIGRTLSPDTWSNLFAGQKEISMLQLQWKIVHNVFPTNIILKKIGIKESENCDFCQEKDYVEHAFFRCKRLEHFWDNIFSRINIKLSKNIVFNETSLLLGIEQEYQDLSFQEIGFINSICILGKLSINKNRMNNIPLEIIFERELRLRNIEL